MLVHTSIDIEDKSIESVNVTETKYFITDLIEKCSITLK